MCNLETFENQKPGVKEFRVLLNYSDHENVEECDT